MNGTAAVCSIPLPLYALDDLMSTVMLSIIRNLMVFHCNVKHCWYEPIHNLILCFSVMWDLTLLQYVLISNKILSYTGFKNAFKASKNQINTYFPLK